MRLTPLALLFAGLALWIVLWPLASRADDVPFAGTWASDVGQCKTEQSLEGAPLILTATSYNQGEAHCTFDSVSQDSGAWLAKAKCSVEGEDQEGTFTFVVDGDKLTIRDDSGERSLSRCP
jgi:hypothetical protein